MKNNISFKELKNDTEILGQAVFKLLKQSKYCFDQ